MVPLAIKVPPMLAAWWIYATCTVPDLPWPSLTGVPLRTRPSLAGPLPHWLQAVRELGHPDARSSRASLPLWFQMPALHVCVRDQLKSA